MISRLLGTLGSALILVTNLSAGFEPHARKLFFSGQTEMASLVRRMAAVRAQQPKDLRGAPTITLLDSYSCAPVNFEAQYNDSAKREFGSFLVKDIEVRCVETVSAAKNLLRHDPGSFAFVVLTDDRHKPAYARMLHTQLNVLVYEEVRDTHDLYLLEAR